MSDANLDVPFDGQTVPCQQHIREQALHGCVPLTQPDHKQDSSSCQAFVAKRLPDIGQALVQPEDRHDQCADSTSEGHMLATSSGSDCIMPDAAQPVSQVLPDTAMELWDFGDSQQPQTDGLASQADTCPNAAEALKELEDFCKSKAPPC